MNREPSEIDRELLALLNSKRPAAELVEPVRDVLGRGADVNVRGNYGLTPLHLAAWKREVGAVELVTLLLDAGADVHAVGTANVSPLAIAIEHNDTAAPAAIEASLALVDLLEARGGKLPEPCALADFACASRRIFERVMKLGASPVVRNARGDQAIHAVVATARPALVQALLDHGVPLDEPGGLGRSPLGMALAVEPTIDPLESARVEIIAMLERRGAPRHVDLPHSGDPFAPVAIDVAGLRAAVSEAVVGRSIMTGLARDFASAQELVAGVADYGEPEKRVAFYERARAFAAPRDAELDGDVRVHRSMFVNGDLVVHGHLRIDEPFVVTGSLTVDGVITDNGNDSWVTVVGDIRCRALYSSGEFAAGGVVTATDVILGYYNDFTLAADRLRATLVIEDEHATAAGVEAGRADPGLFSQALKARVQLLYPRSPL